MQPIARHHGVSLARIDGVAQNGAGMRE